MVEIHPPVIACRILVLKAVLKPSLMAELFDKKCNRASEARASSKCLTICDNYIYPNGKSGMRCPRFSVLCHPGRHNRCLNWRIQPQEVHDKLPLYSSQETWRCQNASKRTCRTFRPTEIWKGMRKDAGIGELGRFVTGFGEREEVHEDGVLQLFQ